MLTLTLLSYFCLFYLDLLFILSDILVFLCCCFHNHTLWPSFLPHFADLDLLFLTLLAVLVFPSFPFGLLLVVLSLPFYFFGLGSLFRFTTTGLLFVCCFFDMLLTTNMFRTVLSLLLLLSRLDTLYYNIHKQLSIYSLQLSSNAMLFFYSKTILFYFICFFVTIFLNNFFSLYLSHFWLIIRFILMIFFIVLIPTLSYKIYMYFYSLTIHLYIYYVYNFYNFNIILNILLNSIKITITKYQTLPILDLTFLSFISTHYNISHISRLSLPLSTFSFILSSFLSSFTNTTYIFTNLSYPHFLIFFLYLLSLISSSTLYYSSIFLFYSPHPIYLYTNNPAFFIFLTLLSYLLYNIYVHIFPLFLHNYISIYTIFSFFYIFLFYISIFLCLILLYYCLFLYSTNNIFFLMTLHIPFFTLRANKISVFILTPFCFSFLSYLLSF